MEILNLAFLTSIDKSPIITYLFNNNVNIKYVVTPSIKKNPRVSPMIELCNQLGIATIEIEKDGLKKFLLEYNVDVLITSGYMKIIDEDAIKLPKYSINIHPTLLPKYRGAHSGWYIIANNENETGITAHFLDKEMDCGDIILQKKIKLNKFDTSKSMMIKTNQLEPEVVYEVIQLISRNEIKRYKQDESNATIYKRLRTPEDSVINPEKKLLELFDEIRACDSEKYPAFFYLDGRKVFIKLWTKDKQFDDEV